MIEPPVRDVQLRELELLRELARRCEAEQLRWFVIGGTLLGAVRHQGFIPWDDDIDIGMPRPDYDRFEALCRRSADRTFVWQSPSTNRGYPFIYGKLVLADTLAPDPATAHLPIHHGRYLDVFPIDGAPASRLARRAHAAALKLAVTALGARIRRPGRRGLVAVVLRIVPRRAAGALLRWLTRRYPFDASPYAVNAGGAWGYRRECQPRDRLVPTTEVRFEGLAVPAPGRWHEYLTQVYGDYRRLPPQHERRTRHALAIGRRGQPADAVAATSPGPEP